MGFNFPNPPLTVGQIFSPVSGLRYQWNGANWDGLPFLGTALPYNYVVNPTFSVSQENGNTGGTTVGYYAADQWCTDHVSSAGVFTRQRVQVVTPNNSVNRYRLTITTADAALAAGEYLRIYQMIEGSRVAGFKWGTASAVQAILRFGWKSPAGTYSVAIQNLTPNRSFVANFTISAGQANTDTVQTIVIPGDTTGTWAIDVLVGMFLMFTVATGTTYQGATGWQAGNFLGTSSNSNGMGTAAAIFELFDVGLYMDPDATGLPPRWVAPPEPDNTMECLRFWYPARGAMGVVAAATLSGRLGRIHPVTMRVVPTVSVGTVGGAVCYNWTYTTAIAITSITNISTTHALEFNGGCAGGLSGLACSLLPDYPGYLAVSARY